MFNIGLVELLVIVFFALIFIKPEDLPKITNRLGLFYRKINQYIFNLKHDLTNLDIEELEKKKSKNKKK
tara:strand:- start:97 stop:303 length:207 start_codon:yes stop_codon:yes gene_type:complete